MRKRARQVARRHHLADVVAVPEPGHAVRHAEGLRQRPQLAVVGPLVRMRLARHHAVRIHPRRAQSRDQAQQILVALPPRDAARQQNRPPPLQLRVFPPPARQPRRVRPVTARKLLRRHPAMDHRQTLPSHPRIIPQHILAHALRHRDHPLAAGHHRRIGVHRVKPMHRAHQPGPRRRVHLPPRQPRHPTRRARADVQHVRSLRLQQTPQRAHLQQRAETLFMHRQRHMPRAAAPQLRDHASAVGNHQRLVPLGHQTTRHLQRAALHAAGIQLGQDLQYLHREISSANHRATIKSAHRPAS